MISQPVLERLELAKGSNHTSLSIGPIIPKETIVVPKLLKSLDEALEEALLLDFWR